LFIRHETDV
jgi:hypothetical protein